MNGGFNREITYKWSIFHWLATSMVGHNCPNFGSWTSFYPKTSLHLDYWIIGLLIQDVSSVVDIGYHIVGEAGVQQKQGVSSDVLPRCWTATQKRAIWKKPLPEDMTFPFTQHHHNAIHDSKSLCSALPWWIFEVASCNMFQSSNVYKRPRTLLSRSGYPFCRSACRKTCKRSRPGAGVIITALEQAPASGNHWYTWYCFWFEHIWRIK